MITNPKRIGYEEMAVRDFQQRSAALKKLFVTNFQGIQRKIPELILRTYFLDWFSGKVKDTDGSIRVQWLNIAGSMYEPVMIVDANGNAVRRVPPLCDRNVVGVAMRTAEGKSKTDPSVGSLLERANNTATLNANMANNQLATKLSDNFLATTTSSANAELVAEWRELLAYYGVTENANSEIANKPNSDTPSTFDFDFE